MSGKRPSQHLGERDASVGGSVGGDVVTGSQTTAYDQRQQQVERQVNVVIYQGRWGGMRHEELHPGGGCSDGAFSTASMRYFWNSALAADTNIATPLIYTQSNVRDMDNLASNNTCLTDHFLWVSFPCYLCLYGDKIKGFVEEAWEKCVVFLLTYGALSSIIGSSRAAQYGFNCASWF